MEIIKAKNIGFCTGVNNTIKQAKKLLNNEQNKVYCLREIVHNEKVISTLKKDGLIFTDDINMIPDNSTVIFRAHGACIETYDFAKRKNLNIIDLTCGKVRIIHNKVKKFSSNYFIIIIGKLTHPEVVATKSFAKDNSIVINSIDDIDVAFKKYSNQEKKKIYVCSQTTYSTTKFYEIVAAIKNKFKDIEIEVDNTICTSTIDRQEEVKDISKRADIVLVVGDKLSSNTKELYNIAIQNCKKVYLIQDIKDLEKVKLAGVIGVVSGASTPIEMVNELIDKM